MSAISPNTLHYASRQTVLAGALAAMLTFTGCGGNSHKARTASTPHAVTTVVKRPPPPPAFEITSAALSKTKGSALIPAQYTCDGANTSPPLAWSNVPPKTAELDLFVLHFIPGHGGHVDWAVAGLKPSQHGLATGESGDAIAGKNSLGRTGYNVCPPKGGTQQYLLALYALPRRFAVRPGFDAGQLFSKITTSLKLFSGSLKLAAQLFSYHRS